MIKKNRKESQEGITNLNKENKILSNKNRFENIKVEYRQSKSPEKKYQYCSSDQNILEN